jgi:hypothetical protein
MAKCDHCGNEDDNIVRITQDGRTMTFDRFECAIHASAETCAHIAESSVHGVVLGRSIYYWANCAKQEGAAAVRDRS